MITKGEIVLYRLSGDDARAINRRRTTGLSIANRMAMTTPGVAPSGAKEEIAAWPAGAQAHIGNNVAEGQVFPAVVVQDFGGVSPNVNLQVWLDGNDTYWATGRQEDSGKEPAEGTWSRRA